MCLGLGFGVWGLGFGAKGGRAAPFSSSLVCFPIFKRDFSKLGQANPFSASVCFGV